MQQDNRSYGVETWSGKGVSSAPVRTTPGATPPPPGPRPTAPTGGYASARAGVYGTSGPLVPEDDGPHVPTDDPMWRESNYITFYDPRQELYGQCWMGFRPNADRGEVQMYVYQAGRPIWKYVNWGGLQVAGDQRREQLGPVRFAPIEPFRKWRLEVRDGNTEIDLTWEAGHDPYDYDWEPLTNSRRYQHAGTVHGRLRAGGEDWKIEEAFGERDRAWGARDHSMFEQWSWFVAHSAEQFVHGTIITVAGEDLVFGYKADAGGPTVPLTTVGMDTDYPYDLGPPDRARFAVSGNDGSKTRLSAVVKNVRPSAFGDGGAFGVLYFCPARITFEDGTKGVGQLDYMWTNRDAYRSLIQASR